MRLLKWVSYLLLSAIALAGLLLALLFNLDFSRLKPQVEVLLSELLGRELAVRGDLTVEINLDNGITLRANDAHLASTEWSTQPRLAALDYLEARLAWRGLLAKPILISEISVRGLNLFLQRDEQNRNNWALGTGQTEAATGSEERFALPILIQRLEATDSWLEYRSPALLEPLDVRLPTLNQRRERNGAISLQASGTVNEEALAVDLDVGATSDTVNLRDIRLDWSANLGEISLRGNTEIADLLDPSRPTLNLRLQGPNFEYLTDLLRMRRITTGPLQLDASLAPAEELMLLEVEGTAGEFEVMAHGEYRDLRELKQARVVVSAAGPSAGHVGALLGFSQLPEEPFTLEGTLARSGQSVTIESAQLSIAESSLQLIASFPVFPDPTDAKLQLRLQGKDLSEHAATLNLPASLNGPFQAQVDLWPGDNQGADFTGWMSIDKLGSRLNVLGSVLNSDGYVGSHLQWRVTADSLARAASAMDFDTALDLPLVASGDLTLEERGIRLDNGQAALGANRNTLSAYLDLPLTDPGGEIRLNAAGDSLGMLLPGSAAMESLDHAFELAIRVAVLDEGIYIREASLSSDGSDIKLSGQLGRAPDFLGTGLQTTLTLADLSRLNPLLDTDLPVMPFSAESLIVQNDNELNFRGLRAAFDSSEVGGDLTVITGELPHIKATMRSDYFDVTPFLPPREATQKETEPAARASTRDSRATARRLIPETELDLAPLSRFSADVGIEVSTLKIEAQTVNDFILKANVQDGRLRVPHAELRAPRGGWMQGQMTAQPVAGGAEVMGRLVGENMTLGLPARNSQEVEQLPRYDLGLGFIGQGANLREFAAGLNAYVRVESGEGRLRTGALRLFTGDFATELLQTLNPFQKTDPFSNVQCLTVFAAVEEGILKGEPAVVLQTDRIRIVSDTRVDLATERLSAYFKTTPQKGIGFSFSSLVNPYVMVTGTLAGPVLTLDPEGALIQGGAAIATGGLSIIAMGFKDRFLSTKDPCGQALLDSDERVKELEARYAREKLAAEGL
ncbi:MAG: AsmA family protein [Pseudomonadota bacterium]